MREQPRLDVYALDQPAEPTRAEAVRLLLVMADGGNQNAKDGCRPPIWTSRCDAAVRVLGLDADTYRARDNDNWPLHLRGRLVEPNTLRAHVEAAEASA